MIVRSALVGRVPVSPVSEPCSWCSCIRGAALSGALAEGSPRFALGVSGAAFGLLFLQTGLDLLRAGGPTLPLLALSGPLGVVGLTLIGLLYGTVGVWLLGVMPFVGTRPFGGTLELRPTVRAMGSATARRSSMFSSAWPPTCSWAVPLPSL